MGHAKSWHPVGQSQLNADNRVTDEGRPQGAPLPESVILTRFCPYCMQLPWAAGVRLDKPGVLTFNGVLPTCPLEFLF